MTVDEQFLSKDLDDYSLYNNRELSWLGFNYRVLEEALDESNPLLDRLKFLAIYSSNLDEFFMVRVAGLLDQVKAGYTKRENKAGLTPKEQLSAISKMAHPMMAVHDQAYLNELMPLLKQENINILPLKDLSSSDLTYVEQMFDEEIFPVLTPMAVDAYRPFPMLLNKSLNLGVVIDKKKAETTKKQSFPFYGHFVIVQVPSVVDRLIELPAKQNQRQFVLMEDVISKYIDKFFTGYQIRSTTLFRITRNADLNIHEDEAEDLLIEIEEELKKRKWGAAVRLEVQAKQNDPQVIEYLKAELAIHEKDVYRINAPLDLTFLFGLSKTLVSTHPDLESAALIPKQSVDVVAHTDIFAQIKNKDILLHHPYDTFDTVIDFVSTAAEDPKVLAIKQTLYRVSGDSPIINSLKRAAENGKQVTVLVELKARFDEENNVQWSKELEKAGCHVIYGMTHLKTHSKITLVVRKERTKIRRYVHLGTGNYNDATAKIYTDMGLLSANDQLGIDAMNFFNYLSGYMDQPTYRQFFVAPYGIRDQLMQLIDEEITYHRMHKNGHIILKMNALTDKIIMKKLFQASIAGVKVDLIVRGVCCLRPGIEGMSDNITVRSIVGQFLEHTRIYYFNHNDSDKIYLSSADLMTRNMENRVEIMFPILEDHLKQRISDYLALVMKDNVKAREQYRNGQYYYVNQTDQPKIDSQSIMANDQYPRESKIPDQRDKQRQTSFEKIKAFFNK